MMQQLGNLAPPVFHQSLDIAPEHVAQLPAVLKHQELAD
jgi:hypothetical protein